MQANRADCGQLRSHVDSLDNNAPNLNYLVGFRLLMIHLITGSPYMSTALSSDHKPTVGFPTVTVAMKVKDQFETE